MASLTATSPLPLLQDQQGEDVVFKAEGLGELLVFMRQKLQSVVCKATKACKVGFSKIDEGG